MSDYFEMAQSLDELPAMHPDYQRARRRLRDIRRYIKKPLTAADVAGFGEMWREAADKAPDGVECVRLVDDLIEQNAPLKW